jgi:hypothetical protein
MEYVLKLVQLFLFCLGITYLGAWAFVAAEVNALCYPARETLSTQWG